MIQKKQIDNDVDHLPIWDKPKFLTIMAKQISE